MRSNGLTSIWSGKYRNQAEWEAQSRSTSEIARLTSEIDDAMVRRTSAFRIGAYCACCASPQNMMFDWSLSLTQPDKIVIAWTEKLACDNCGMNSRMRAVWDFVTSRLGGLNEGSAVYLPERITPGFVKWKERFPLAVGSEYVGPEARSGTYHKVGALDDVLHQDLTHLDFPDASFDLIISQDVFEHIPSYRRAFQECSRVLKRGGTLVFSIPFFPELAKTQVRATLHENGDIHSDYPLEYHGDPMSSAGSLCFQHFGWDILDELRVSGFSEAFAHSYWSPLQGHLGAPYFVFSAIR